MGSGYNCFCHLLLKCFYCFLKMRHANLGMSILKMCFNKREELLEKLFSALMSKIPVRKKFSQVSNLFAKLINCLLDYHFGYLDWCQKFQINCRLRFLSISFSSCKLVSQFAWFGIVLRGVCQSSNKEWVFIVFI